MEKWRKNLEGAGGSGVGSSRFSFCGFSGVGLLLPEKRNPPPLSLRFRCLGCPLRYFARTSLVWVLGVVLWVFAVALLGKRGGPQLCGKKRRCPSMPLAAWARLPPAAGSGVLGTAVGLAARRLALRACPFCRLLPQ